MTKQDRKLLPEKEIGYVKWCNLPFQKKIDIVNHYWSPYNEQKGLTTRKEIISEFKKKLDVDNIIDIKFKWYGWYNIAIFVKLKNHSKTRLPRKFDIFEVKKVDSQK